MKIILTGRTSQVGYELARSLQGLGEIISADRCQMDLAQVRNMIRATKPNLIINPAAYTAVDKARSKSELAMHINGEAPDVVTEEAKKLGAAMIHYSTDYFFGGTSVYGAAGGRIGLHSQVPAGCGGDVPVTRH